MDLKGKHQVSPFFISPDILERSLEFYRQIRDYVTDVVFYCADYINLLPVVHYTNNRREFSYDEQEPS